MKLPIAVIVAAAWCGAALAQEGDVEMACVSALAEQAGVDMAQVETVGTEEAGEGTQVNLVIDGTAPWACFVNDAGEVTSLESLGEG